MPSLSREFTIELGKELLWAALTDEMRLARCIPGYEDASITSPSEFTWKGKINVGIVSKKIDAQVKIVNRAQLDQLTFSLESEDGDIIGEFGVRLFSESSSLTRMSVNANIQAQGPFKWIVNKVIENQLEKFIREFKACIIMQS